MKLTPKEKAICKQYGEDALKKYGTTNCDICPLCIDAHWLMCYANIDEDSIEAQEVRERRKHEG